MDGNIEGEGRLTAIRPFELADGRGTPGWVLMEVLSRACVLMCASRAGCPISASALGDSGANRVMQLIPDVVETVGRFCEKREAERMRVCGRGDTNEFIYRLSVREDTAD